MNIDYVELQPTDVILVMYNIGLLAADKVDVHCDTVLAKLKETFNCEVTLIPLREGPLWDFTLIRNARTKKLKKVAK